MKLVAVILAMALCDLGVCADAEIPPEFKKAFEKRDATLLKHENFKKTRSQIGNSFRRDVDRIRSQEL